MTHALIPPAPKGPYSTTRRIGDVLYLSGQGSIEPTTGVAVLDDIRSQTERTLANIRALLRSEGFDLDDLVQVTCYLTDIHEWASMNAAYADFFKGGATPVRTAVEVSALPFGLSIEMSCVAHRQSETRTPGLT